MAALGKQLIVVVNLSAVRALVIVIAAAGGALLLSISNATLILADLNNVEALILDLENVRYVTLLNLVYHMVQTP